MGQSVVETAAALDYQRALELQKVAHRLTQDHHTATFIAPRIQTRCKQKINYNQYTNIKKSKEKCLKTNLRIATITQTSSSPKTEL